MTTKFWASPYIRTEQRVMTSNTHKSVALSNKGFDRVKYTTLENKLFSEEKTVIEQTTIHCITRTRKQLTEKKRQ